MPHAVRRPHVHQPHFLTAQVQEVARPDPVGVAAPMRGLPVPQQEDRKLEPVLLLVADPRGVAEVHVADGNGSQFLLVTSAVSGALRSLLSEDLFLNVHDVQVRLDPLLPHRQMEQSHLEPAAVGVDQVARNVLPHPDGRRAGQVEFEGLGPCGQRPPGEAPDPPFIRPIPGQEPLHRQHGEGVIRTVRLGQAL